MDEDFRAGVLDAHWFMNREPAPTMTPQTTHPHIDNPPATSCAELISALRRLIKCPHQVDATHDYADALDEAFLAYGRQIEWEKPNEVFSTTVVFRRIEGSGLLLFQKM